MDKDLQFQCLKIPIKVLRKELPDLKSRKRQDFLDELERINPDKLKKLAMYYSLNATKSIYLYKLKQALNKSKLTAQNIKSLLNKKIKTNGGPIFIINQATVDEKKKEAYLRIQGFSAIRTLKAARPESLESFKEDYRSKFLMYLVVHIDTTYIECRSSYSARAELATKILSQALYNKEDEFQPIVLSKSQQESLNKSATAKKAYIDNLNWAGCESISLEGENVERTIDEFKKKGIDFAGMGASISLDDRKSDGGIAFFSDGKIAFKNIENPYNKIRSILVAKKNEQLDTSNP